MSLGTDSAQRPVANHRVDVEAELLVQGGCGAGPVNLLLAPVLGEQPERDPAGGGVDVVPHQLRMLDPGQEALGVDSAAERPRSLLAASGLPVAGSPPAVSTTLDVTQVVAPPVLLTSEVDVR